MNTKEKYEDIKVSMLPEKTRDTLEKIKRATKDFSVQNDKADAYVSAVHSKLKKEKPSALRSEDKKPEPKPEPKKAAPKPKPEPKTKPEPKPKPTKTAVKATTTKVNALTTALQNDPLLKGLGKTDKERDAGRRALPAGRRVSKKGWKNQHGTSKGGRVYYENRENRSDRKSPDYKGGYPYLAMGGYTHKNDNDGEFTVSTYRIIDGKKKLIQEKKYKDSDSAVTYAMMKGNFKGIGESIIVTDKDGKWLYKSINNKSKGGYMADGGNVGRDYVEWETEVTQILADKLDIDYGDASGIVEAQPFYLQQSWTKGLSAEETADVIDEKSMMAKGGYTAKGEDYEYKNTFKRFDSKVPVPQDDFEKFVDAWHKQKEGDKLDKAKYKVLKQQMGNYLGHKTVQEMEDYVEKTHKRQRMAHGGEIEQEMVIAKFNNAKDKADFKSDLSNVAPDSDFSIVDLDGNTVQVMYDLDNKEIVTDVLKSYSSDYYAKGGSIDSRLKRYATLDINLLQSQGYMAITDTKLGVISGEYENGTFTFRNVKGEKVFSGNKKGAIDFVKNNYQLEQMAKGGQVKGFDALSKKVAARYEGKKVPSKYQGEYGKTYDKEEAKEVGDKVAAKVYRLQLAKKGKMAKGGEIKKGDRVRSTVFKDEEGEVLNKKGDMLFVRKDDNGKYKHDVFRISEVEKLAKGGNVGKVPFDAEKTSSGYYRLKGKIPYDLYDELGRNNLSEEQLEYSRGSRSKSDYNRLMQIANDVSVSQYDYNTNEAVFLASSLKDVKNWEKQHSSKVYVKYAKGGKLDQGFNDRLDESMGNRDGKEAKMEATLKDRRNESKGENKAVGKRPYSSVHTMDKMAEGGELGKIKLPHNLKKYFTKPAGTIEVEMNKLIPIRAREKGIANAERYMRLAYDGKMEKRKPITIYKSRNGKYRIKDGNSTFAVAKKHNWKTIWAEVVENPNISKRKENSVFTVASKIRKEGESWASAVKRAGAMNKK